MKRLLAIALTIISLNATAQTKEKTDTAGKWVNIALTVDSTNWKQFYYVFGAGLENLMKTKIPADEVEGLQKWGQSIMIQLVEMYNKRYPKKQEVTSATK